MERKLMMMLQGLGVQMRDLAIGSALMLLCLLLYLAWWCIVFKPGSSSNVLSTTCIILAFATGIASVVMSIHGISAQTDSTPAVPVWGIVVGGLVAYIALFLVSFFLLHRQVTSELLIIVGWSVLELASLDIARACGGMNVQVVLVFAIIIVIVAAGSFVCYLLYYQLPPMAGYIDGMIPLIAGSVLMAAMTVAIMLGSAS